MDPVPLDPDLVARFKDQTMAIVGYETDQGQNLVVFFLLSGTQIVNPDVDQVDSILTT